MATNPTVGAGLAPAARVSVSGLTGVPETMLWPLYHRAAEARRPDALLTDPRAVEIADAIDYDYPRNFGKPDFALALRAIRLDELLRGWLADNPRGQVVALGEGLETQCVRLDNSSVRWLSVDLPEAIAIRERFLPDTDRRGNLACSATDFRWMDGVAADGPVFITAAGLLMYLPPAEVRRLVAGIAGRFPSVQMAFDVLPRWMSERSLRGLKLTPHYQTPPMPWAMDRDELPSIATWHPDIAEVRELNYYGGRGFFYGKFLPVLRRLPRVGNKVPSLVHLLCKPATP